MTPIIVLIYLIPDSCCILACRNECYRLGSVKHGTVYTKK